jgi:hypothetical protein
VIGSKPRDCSVAAWCERRGVSKQSFYLWQRKLKPAATVAPLLPVVIRATGAPLEIHFPGGVVLHLRASCDAQLLRETLVALHSVVAEDLSC